MPGLDKQNNNRLNLSVEEVQGFSKLVKDLKFPNKGTQTIYPGTEIEKARLYVKAYRFIYSIANARDTDKEIKKKIETYLKHHEQLYDKLCGLLYNYDLDVQFGKQKVKMKISSLILENRKVVDTLLDEVFDIGRSIKYNDPEQFQGNY